MNPVITPALNTDNKFEGRFAIIGNCMGNSSLLCNPRVIN